MKSNPVYIDYTRGWPAIFLLSAICYLTLFTRMDLLPPSLMEARNFISAREIVESGNWLIPTLNGEPRIAKPPLPTWATALSGSIGGLDNLTALRLPAALAATLMVLFCYGLGRVLTTPRVALLSGVVLASCQLFIRVGRQGSWDIFCHSFMLGAIWVLALAFKSPGRAWGYYISAGLGLGLAFMSKGPVPFYSLLLPCLIAGGLVFGFRPRRWSKKPKWSGLLATALTALVVAAPWPLYVLTHAGDLSMAVTQQETHAWLSRHMQPFWHYLSFPVNTGLWTPFALAALISPRMRPRMADFRKYRLFLFWCLSSVVLLSLVPEKKERYLFPVMVPLAYLVGLLWNYLLGLGRLSAASQGEQRLVRSTNLILGLLVLIVAEACLWVEWQGNLDGPKTWVSFPVLVMVFTAGISFYNIRCQAWGLGLAMPLLLSCSLVVFALPYYAKLGHHNPDFRTLASSRDLPQIEDLPLYSLGDMNPKQIWEAGRVVRPWQPGDEPRWPENKAFAIFTPSPPIEALSRLIHEQDSVIEVVDAFAYDPKKPERIWYLAVVKPSNP